METGQTLESGEVRVPEGAELDKILRGLIEQYLESGSLEGIRLPAGVTFESLMRSFFEVRQPYLASGNGYLQDLLDELVVQSLTVKEPLSEILKGDGPVHALVEWGTEGAISLDCCPEGSLYTTGAELRKILGIDG